MAKGKKKDVADEMQQKFEEAQGDETKKAALLLELDELMSKLMPVPPLKLVIKKDFRTLKQGLTVNLTRRFTAIVGDNGAGKSSLLTLLKSNWPGHYMGRREKEAAEHLEVVGLDAFTDKYDYCTESDSAEGKSFGDMDYLLKSVGMAAFRASSGQLQNMQLTQIITKLLKEKPSAANPALLVLDEPESSLSLRARMTLAKTLSHIAFKFNVMIVVATHDESLIAAADRVYDITTGDTMRNGQEYVDSLRKEVDKNLEATFGVR